MSDIPAGMQEYVSDTGPSPQTLIDQKVQSAAPQMAPPPGMADYVAPELQQQQYGGLGQQALSGLEGAARGFSLGASDYIEPQLFPTTAADIKGRMQANPTTSTVGNVAGGLGLIAATDGLGMAAEGAEGAEAAGGATSLAGRAAEALTGGPGLGASVLGGGIEGAAFGLGNAVSDSALGDGNLNAQKILSDVGFGSILGGLGGAAGHGLGSIVSKFGGIKGTVGDAVADEINQTNKAATVANAIDEITPTFAEENKLKPNYQDIIASADHFDLPLSNEQTSASPWHEKAADTLLSGAPSIKGIAKEQHYTSGIDTVTKDVQSALPTSEMSTNQFGDALKGSFVDKINQDAAPYNDLYSAIKEDTEHIPLNEKSAPAISRNILDIANDPKLGKNSPGANLAKQIADEIGDLKTVDDLRGYQSNLNGRLFQSGTTQEKMVLSKVADKLDDWERRTIKGYASDLSSKVDMSNPEEAATWGPKVDRLNSLLSRIDAADAQYAPFRKNIGELGEWLGKRRVAGAKDATNFIENLEPEDLINKLGQKKYASMYSFMEEKFPQEFALLKEYQKGALRDAATKNGVFSAKTFLDKVDGLGPEIKNSIFSKQDLEKFGHAKTWLNTVPKKYNPSGTSGASAFRAFFESPTGALIGNARDFAIDAYINHVGSLPASIRPNAIQVGQEAAQKFNALNAAQNMIKRTNSRLNESLSSVLGHGGAIASIVGSQSFKQRSDRISELANNPDALVSHIDNNISGMSQHLPNISQGISTTMATSVNYLNSQLPKPPQQLPLSRPTDISEPQKQKFNRIYDAVSDPISVLQYVKDGTVTMDQIHAVQATHPELYNHIKDNFMKVDPREAMNLPYKRKLAMGMFLGTPLDESMIQSVALANQGTFAVAQANKNAQQPKSTEGGLAKLNIADKYKTETYREPSEA